VPNKCLQHETLGPAHPLCSAIHQTAIHPEQWAAGRGRGSRGGGGCWVLRRPHCGQSGVVLPAGLGQTRTSTLALPKRLDSGFSPGAGARHSEKEEASAVLCPSPELHRAGGEDNNYWERFKKKSLSNNYSLKKLAGGTENAAWIARWPPPLQARRAAVAKNARRNICNAFKGCSPLRPRRWMEAAPRRARKKAEGGASSNVFSMFDQSQIQEFKEAFTIMDQNRDGFIDKEDLRDTFAALGRINVKNEELEAMVKEAPGPINFTVFLTMFGEKLKGTDPEETILHAFKVFDTEGKGFVKADFIKEKLMTQADRFSEEEVKQMFAAFPPDVCGNLDYRNLCYVITHGEEKD
uniref:Myosin light chain 10 n=1 Tax=Bos indicus x Bos taurus TaxID=30522 RepID=A0A4W2FKI3_BOBOX